MYVFVYMWHTPFPRGQSLTQKLVPSVGVTTGYPASPVTINFSQLVSGVLMNERVQQVNEGQQKVTLEERMGLIFSLLPNCNLHCHRRADGQQHNSTTECFIFVQ